MNGWFNPDNWLDILDHFLLVIGAILAAAIPSWFAAKSRQEIRDVKDQVVNGHKVPMRFDLDKVLARLEDLAGFITEISRGVAGLRSELLDEESRRRDSVRELRSDIEINRDEFRSGISHIERRLLDLEQKIKHYE